MKTFKHYLDALSIRTMSYINYRRGWTTNRKILVIESDDWGAIRMPNLTVYNSLLEKGIFVDRCGYCKYDTLADKHDFEAMYETFVALKDKNNQSLKLTANTIVTNPNFDLIRENNFENFYIERFDETLSRYSNRDLKYWKEGISNGFFKPQLHGREHVNSERWLDALRSNKQHTALAFNHNMYGLSKTVSAEIKESYLEALAVSNPLIEESISQGVEIFESIFGFKSKTFIAPNYCWNDMVEKMLALNSIYGIQGTWVQKKEEKNKYHYLGEINQYNQCYSVRNVSFEPSLVNSDLAVKQAYKQVKKAFSLNKPAIISAHRVNFIGSIQEYNRTNNLILLKSLIEQLIKEYSDLEFMFSDELFDLMINKN